MGETTGIAWTDATFNPWVGCARVSPGCENCYAETADKRRLLGGVTHWGKKAPRHVTSDVYWRGPVKWNRQAEAEGRPKLVFCASQADVFEDRDDLIEPRARLFELIAETPNLIWQLLTKRPENVLAMTPWAWRVGQNPLPGNPEDPAHWPSNVWIGTTVEDQERAELRLPYLADIPGVTFLSCEPLLGPVDLSRWLHLEWMDALRLADEPRTFRTEDGDGGWGREMLAAMAGREPVVDWVIVGGESGPKHRPLDLRYARDILEQCAAAGVPAFFKQHGGARSTSGGDEIDGRRVKEFPWQARRETPITINRGDPR